MRPRPCPPPSSLSTYIFMLWGYIFTLCGWGRGRQRKRGLTCFFFLSFCCLLYWLSLHIFERALAAVCSWLWCSASLQTVSCCCPCCGCHFLSATLLPPAYPAPFTLLPLLNRQQHSTLLEALQKNIISICMCNVNVCLSVCECLCVCQCVMCACVCFWLHFSCSCFYKLQLFCCCTLLLFSATVNAILLCNGSEVRLFTSLSLYRYLFLSLSLSLSLYLSLSLSLSIACCWAAPHKPIPFKYLLIYALFVFHSTRVRQLPHPLPPLPPPARHWFTAPL